MSYYGDGHANVHNAVLCAACRVSADGVNDVDVFVSHTAGLLAAFLHFLCVCCQVVYVASARVVNTNQFCGVLLFVFPFGKLLRNNYGIVVIVGEKMLLVCRA